ncbi:hypothetical protein BV898_16369 [Hypsibius exemplaris]|uniref:G-protein coupled receptors family 1 profile domain-containing protein n=1 Tax=Hypsibius exemplaris TaxID=2072580 RepID=A0A9X6NFR3_HYPEX|nr:hypothetical protein BV898_16369 [Hypsibius exemplaris]
MNHNFSTKATMSFMFINSSSNSTKISYFLSNSTVSTAAWTFSSGLFVCIAAAGFVLNLLSLVTFTRDRTPFNIIVIQLLTINLVSSVTQWGLNAVIILYPGGVEGRMCDLYLFSNTIFSGMIRNTHGLMAVNRVWAVLHPFSYRRLHTSRLALGICLGLCVYVFLTMFPYFLLDALKYREAKGCALNVAAQVAYTVAGPLVLSSLPMAVVWVAFVVVTAKRIACRRHGNGIRDMRPSRTNIVSANVHTIPPAHSENGRLRKRQWRSTLLLAILTISITVCYGPRTVFLVLKLFWPSTASTSFFQVANMLFACQIVLDPILLTLTMGKLPAVRC